MGGKPRLSEEEIERFRQTGIRLDRNGRFWHEGVQITHPGLCRALLSWLDRLDDGRRILRLDATRYAYVEIEDADLLVTSLLWDAKQPRVHLNDGSEEPLNLDSLRVAKDNALYCDVRDGRLTARFTTPAYYALTEHLEQTPEGFVIRDARRNHRIRRM
jgi:hypothetical protein